ncbi:hypothetical protein SAY87_005454 [Trapa incisa]|uniref:BZIP domain-containing protein n=1 Tax=Trapa incisa TaxID=236973 RepID=A0AAN7Q6G7_9MYRT|nr:hypothetical protein SAY87_005454 [Trapa incisa]
MVSMASGSKNNNRPYRGLKLELVQSQSRPEPALVPTEQMLSPPLGHQNSVLSLTLGEIQLKSGRSFGSMNMDELLANIWSVDEVGPGPSSPLLVPPLENEPTLLRQASSFSIPTPLSTKTVDEVWLEIHNGQPAGNGLVSPRRQQTFGEMTLEDFLVRAGIVQEGPVMAMAMSMASQQQPKSPMSSSAFLKSPPSFVDSVLSLDSGYGTRNIAGLSCNGMMETDYGMMNNSTTCNGLSPCNAFNDTPRGFPGSFRSKNKRVTQIAQETMVVERRQLRMIKNRESAARSRARRQAYTVELEMELNQLKEENQRLQKIVAETEENRRSEVLKRKHKMRAVKTAEQLRAMRRTVSMAW